jgi:hypothetical protein
MRYITLIVLLLASSSAIGKGVSTVGDANANAVAAQAAVKADQSHLDDLTKQMTIAFHQTPKYLVAKAAVDDTQRAYDELCGKVIDGLHADTNYQTLEIARDAAIKAVVDARAAGDPDAIASAAKTAMAARSDVSKREQSALDGNADYPSVKAAMLAARPAFATIEKAFDDSLPADPTIQAAKAQLASDQASAQSAATALATAQAAEHAARVRGGPTISGSILNPFSVGPHGGSGP